MIPHLSSLSSSHLSTPLHTQPSILPPKPYPILLSLRSPNPNHPPRRVRSSPPPPPPPPPPPMMIGIPPDPPWPNPFPAAELFDFQANAPATALPFSLRLLQLRKKRAAAAAPRGLGAAENAVRSLASAIEDLHRFVAPRDRDDDASRDSSESLDASRDSSESLVWLFCTVFSSSPCFFVAILDLMERFLALPVATEIAKAIAQSRRSDEIVRSEIGKYKCWFDVGILDDEDGDKLRSDDRSDASDYARRRSAYERLIVADGTNSLILSNYAQLLYQYENDNERANDYFSRAVTAEPLDGEAMGRYALFLWRTQRDPEKAEEMFLEAIQADPGNNHHRRTYAWFLWHTGGFETCYPLEEQ